MIDYIENNCYFYEKLIQIFPKIYRSLPIKIKEDIACAYQAVLGRDDMIFSVPITVTNSKDFITKIFSIKPYLLDKLDPKREYNTEIILELLKINRLFTVDFYLCQVNEEWTNKELVKQFLMVHPFLLEKFDPHKDNCDEFIIEYYELKLKKEFHYILLTKNLLLPHEINDDWLTEKEVTEYLYKNNNNNNIKNNYFYFSFPKLISYVKFMIKKLMFDNIPENLKKDIRVLEILKNHDLYQFIKQIKYIDDDYFFNLITKQPMLFQLLKNHPAKNKIEIIKKAISECPSLVEHLDVHLFGNENLLQYLKINKISFRHRLIEINDPEIATNIMVYDVDSYYHFSEEIKNLCRYKTIHFALC
jgi:hypothetical protein